jgi:16S rRNA U1498 N3-methylase RsmE
MTIRRRQPRMSPGTRRHVQIYLDEQLHARIRLLAMQQGVSFSRAARELMELGASSIQPTATDSNVD